MKKKKITAIRQNDGRGDHDERVFFTLDANPGKEYTLAAWHRCPGIQRFVENLEEHNAIVGIIAQGNMIGFIVDPKD